MSGSKNTQIVQVEANQNAKNTKAVPVEANQNSQNTQVAQNKASQKAEALTQADEEYWDHGHHSKEELIDAHHGTYMYSYSDALYCDGSKMSYANIGMIK